MHTSSPQTALHRSKWPERAALAASLVLALTSAVAQTTDNAERPTIRWRTGTTQLAPDPTLPAADQITQLLATNAQHFLIQFTRPMSTPQRDALARAGVRLLRSVGANAYFASTDAAHLNAAAITSLAPNAAVRAIDEAWKVHPLLAGDTLDPGIIRAARRGVSPDPDYIPYDEVAATNPTIPVYIIFHADVDAPTAGRKLVRSLGGRVVGRVLSVGALVAELRLSQVATLARDDRVQWIEPALPQLTPTNDANRARVGADVVRDPPYNLDGAGVTVFVFDGDHPLPTHPDLIGRVTTIDGDSVAQHATHVTGTIAGDGTASDGRYRGMAPAVQIVSGAIDIDPNTLFLYENPCDIESDYELAINGYNVDLASNSLGSNADSSGFPCEVQGDYGVTASLLDGIVRGSLGRPLPVLFAGGNERIGIRCDIEGYGKYYSTAPPAGAKNIIAVGAINSNNDSITTFSSWGPVDDGRLRPDIVGPGCQSDDDHGVTSCSASGGYATLCGTSMATPTVAGLSALMMQDYRDRFPAQPMFAPATLKALLAHTAVDLGNPGPDYRFGYGSVRIQPAVDQLRSGNGQEGVLDQDDVWAYAIDIDPNDVQLKITLTWDDAPAVPNTAAALVNDLDLRVFDPTGTRVFPWTLDPENPDAPATRDKPDHTNNIEQVFVDHPTPGRYRVEVHGHYVPEGPQTFSIVSSTPLFDCSPTGGVSLDRESVACESSLLVFVADCDLNLDPDAVESTDVLVFSGSEPAGETVTLIESSADSSLFTGTLPLSAGDAPGTLLVSNGEVVTARYIDANDGRGHFDVPNEAHATVVCIPPQVLSVEFTDVGARRAAARIVTNEPTRAFTTYGELCASPTGSDVSLDFTTEHTFAIRDLTPETTYAVSFQIIDAAGNATIDDNDGACYTFTTPPAPRHFVEVFFHNFDLKRTSVMFTPDGSPSYYSACAEPIDDLPVPPADGTLLPLNDESIARIHLADDRAVYVFGRRYSEFFVSSNGFVSFGEAELGSFTDKPGEYENPQVAALSADLDPNAAGAVRWQQLDDRVVVTWRNVPLSGEETKNTAQIGLFYDGRIELAYGFVSAYFAVCGVSQGPGADVVDLSEQHDCSIVGPPHAISYETSTIRGTPLVLEPAAADDGLPDPPGALTFTLLSLPAQPLRNLQTNELLTPADLPATFPAGAARLQYEPAPSFIGDDAFQFIANDGGTPPEGGSSDTATVTIHVKRLLTPPFADTFDTAAFDPNHWAIVSGATIDNDAVLAPPSPTFALRLNGDPDAGDRLTSQWLNLASLGPVLFEYSWERGGGGDPPRSQADLSLQYFSVDGLWQDLATHAGGGDPTTTFTRERLYLPDDALHARAKLRIRNAADMGPYHDWFVDDIVLRPSTEPLAYSRRVSTFRATPVEFVLRGFDPEDEPLDTIIETLPKHGTLRDPAAGAIMATPYTLAAGGRTVVYTPRPRTVGEDAFAFHVHDGTFASEPASVVIEVVPREPLYSFPLDADPGWTRDEGWQFGPPGGTGERGDDPNAAATGENVFGYMLGGDYPNNLPETQHLTAGPFDCTGRDSVSLEFQRWLSVLYPDVANVQISTDGAEWTTVWSNPIGSLYDDEWRAIELDISAIADGQPTVYVRWGMGPTDSVTTFGGWNLDDIAIWADEIPCPADLDGDGRIGVGDLSTLLNHYASENAAFAENGDVNGNGRIDLTDLGMLLAIYGSECD